MPNSDVASFFSGIGGFELAFGAAGFAPTILCDIDKSAQRVLRSRFPKVRLSRDVTKLVNLPSCEVLVAGWPCQDLSQAGKTAGLDGDQSGLIKEIFRLLDSRSKKPPIVVLENVAFALSLSGGAAIKFVTDELEARGYHWAYRVLDTQWFGLPQRRRRIYVVASLEDDAEAILLDGVYSPVTPHEAVDHVGFYWTEGNRGLGWTPDAVPPLKGGSALSIPSPPAIWSKATGEFFTPSIEDAERLQGFEAGWTAAADEDGVSRKRWRLVGNAVSVPVAKWLGARISGRSNLAGFVDERSSEVKTVHNAAWGGPGKVARYLRHASEAPSHWSRVTLAEFGLRDTKPLSFRAANGFLQRYLRSGLTPNAEFSGALKRYCDRLAAPLRDVV